MIYDYEYHLRYMKYQGTETERKLMNFRVNFLHKNLLRYTSLGKYQLTSIVDIGCACGAFLSTLVKQGFHCVQGIDINPCNVCYVRGQGLTAFLPSEFKQQKIEVITLWDVLEHIPDPQTFLNHFDSKVVVISTPCVDGYIDACIKNNIQPDIKEWKHYREGEHLHHWTKNELIDLMNKCGYECVDFTFNESTYRKDSFLGDKNIMSGFFIKKGAVSNV